MGHPTLEYIKGLRKSLETKKAEIVGTPPSEIPGAEHDGKPSEEATKPDAETKDQTMVPNSGLTTEGAGDDSKITHTNDLLAGEAALTPTKKPEVTADADAKTAEALAAEILTGVEAWYAAKKQAEDSKPVADTTPPAAGEGTAEALITDKGKEPEQLKDPIPPTKKPEITTEAMAPATGEGSSGETAAAAKEAGAAAAKEAGHGEECCKDGKCGKCAKCKAAASKSAGALDMELTSDVLAKIAAVMLATEEGTKLAESLLSKAAGAEAAEKTLNFLRDQSELAQKQAEFEAGQRDAIELMKRAADEEAAAAAAAEAAGAAPDGAADAGAAADDGGITEIADTLDAMVESGEITEDEADQVVVELAQALSGGEPAADSTAEAAAAAGEAKTAQAAPEGQAPADAAIDQTVAVDPAQLDPNSVPQGGADDISPDEVADAIDTLVQSGEITEDEADQLVQEIVGGDAGGEAAAGDASGDAAGGDVSPEEIANALQDAVASGELSPADVQQVLTELEGVPADAGAGEAAAAPVAQAAAAAPAAQEAAVPAEEPKTAGAKLMAAINAVRAARAAQAK